jgi:hypothetical protein
MLARSRTSADFAASMTLIVSAALATVVMVLVTRAAADRLAAGFGEALWAARPAPAVFAVMAIAGAAVTVWRSRRRQRRELAAEGDGLPTARNAQSAAALERNFAAVLGGLSAVVLVAWNPPPLVSPLVAPWFEPSLLWLLAVIDIGTLLLATAWLWRCASWRDRHAAAAATPAAPSRRYALFHGYIAWLMATALCGLVLVVWQVVVETWLRHLPWTLWAAVLACMAALAASIVDWRSRPTERRAVLSDAWQAQLWAQGIVAVLAFVIGLNVEGFLASAQQFADATPALRVAFLLMPGLFLALVATVVLCLALPGHHVRVFISFQHGREQSAAELEAALVKSGIAARRIPFRADHQHDELLRSIQDELRRCDAMVCLLGANPSFVENEVLVASTLKKFIVFVVGEHEPRLPNTAFYGYPVFRLERVSRRGWRAVAELFLLVAGHWRASLRFLASSWGRLFDAENSRLLGWLAAAFVGGSYAAGAAVALAAGGGLSAVWAFVRGFHRFYLDVTGGWLMPWLLFNAFLIGSAFALLNLLRTRRVLRQETLTGHLTHELLRQQLGSGKRLNELLAAMWKKPPAAEHETA